MMEELTSAAFPAHKPELSRMEAATTPGGRHKERRWCYLSPRVADTGRCGSHGGPVSRAEDVKEKQPPDTGKGWGRHTLGLDFLQLSDLQADLG